jgi:hypothetical protein
MIGRLGIIRSVRPNGTARKPFRRELSDKQLAMLRRIAAGDTVPGWGYARITVRSLFRKGLIGASVSGDRHPITHKGRAELERRKGYEIHGG